MNNNLYFCTHEYNTCIKKDTCKRYVDYTNEENNCHATLFNTACTEDNNYVLYMKVEEVKEEKSNDV